jgi:small ligand-binding sensory domain FIST
MGVAFTGDVRVDTLVAQGCKPVGRSFRVTGCRQNILTELDHKTPLLILKEMAEGLSPRDRQLMRTSLFLGLAMNPSQDERHRGDFLVRNIMGVDQGKGHLAVGALLRTGQVVQFHVRDAVTSAEDLRAQLHGFSSTKIKPKGALLFSCLGRGQHLYGQSNHDSQLFQEKVGAVPLGGFFCNGEIGPVAGTTYLHGYTSCFGLFSPKNS